MGSGEAGLSVGMLEGSLSALQVVTNRADASMMVISLIFIDLPKQGTWV